MDSQNKALAHAAPDRHAAMRPVIRVLLDARKLGDGGIGVYIDNLIAGLSARGDVRLTVIGKRAQVEQHAWSRGVDVIEDLAKPYSLDELFLMPRRLMTGKYDLFHAPHYTLPFGLKMPAVVTIHDLIHINAPEKFYYPYIAAPIVRSALRRARRVVVVSQSTLGAISQLVRGEARILSKLRVVPNAVAPILVDLPYKPDYLRSRFHLESPYLLAVISMLKHHKGVEDLLQAFARVKEQSVAMFKPPHEAPRGFRELKLVLVGKGTERLVEVEKLLRKAGSIPGVHILGNVAKSDLVHLYRQALALVVPSLAEGFCLPALEAKAVGLRIVARPVPAVLEILDRSDVICRDFSRDALVEGILALFRAGSQSLAETQVKSGPQPEFWARFSVEAVAERTLSIYHEALLAEQQ